MSSKRNISLALQSFINANQHLPEDTLLELDGIVEMCGSPVAVPDKKACKSNQLRKPHALAINSRLQPKLSPQEAQAVLAAKGWPQNRAADELGVHRITLYKIFRGLYRNNRVLHEIEALPKFASSPEHSREDKQANRQAERGIA